MRLLFDQNISFRISKKLSSELGVFTHVSECGLINCDDNVIWNYAKQNKYIIVTYDSDFYDISLINGCPPKIIWIRTGNLSTNQIKDLLLKNIERIRSFSEDSENREIACIELE